jgi:hypothetical protein
MRPLALLLLLLTVVAVRADDYVDKVTGLHFPDTCGNWTKLRAEPYDDPKLGFSVGYQDGRRTLTLYVYQGTYSEIPNGAQGALFQGEMGNVLSGAKEAWGQRGAKVQTLVGASEFKDDKLPGVLALVAAQSIELNGNKLISVSALTGYRNRLVKARYTQPYVGPNTAFRELAEFATALLRANAEGLEPFFKPCLPAETASRN